MTLEEVLNMCFLKLYSITSDSLCIHNNIILNKVGRHTMRRH